MKDTAPNINKGRIKGGSDGGMGSFSRRICPKRGGEFVVTTEVD